MKRKRLSKVIRREVLELYDHQCALCPERRKRWLQVHHLNGNWMDNRLENLLCACIYCHAYVFHPEKADEMIEWWKKKMGFD